MTNEQAPIDMVLHCPNCGMQHIDAQEWIDDPHDIEQGRILGWKNEPHRSHLCHSCGHIWRPADVPTNGVAAVKTTGKADHPIAAKPVPPETVAGAMGQDETEDAPTFVDMKTACHAWNPFCTLREEAAFQSGATWMRNALSQPSTPQSEAAGLTEAAQAYRDAQDALDNYEYAGMNGEPYSVLKRRRDAARDDIDAALAAATKPAGGAE